VLTMRWTIMASEVTSRCTGAVQKNSWQGRLRRLVSI